MTAPTPRPPWWRPASLALVIGAHATAFATVPSPSVVPASGPVEIEVVVEQEVEDRATPDRMPSRKRAPNAAVGTRTDPGARRGTDCGRTGSGASRTGPRHRTRRGRTGPSAAGTAAARRAGLGGTVVDVFVIGPGGSVATHTIVRSSGHAVLDRAVHAMMSAVHLPPPPGGVFRSTVPVRFDLVR